MTPSETQSPSVIKDPYQDLIDAAEEAAVYLEATSSTGTNAVLSCDRLRSTIDALKEHLQNNVDNRGGTLELHGFPDRKMDLAEQLYANAAGSVGRGGELEFDDATIVSISDDSGAYVLGWTWIPEADLEQPHYFEGSLYYVSEGGTRHLLKEDSCIAIDEDDAEQMLIEQHWDARLDSAGCKPLVVWKELTVDTWEFTVNDGSDFATDETVEIDAPSAEVATQILEIMRPNAKIVEDEEDDDTDEDEPE